MDRQRRRVPVLKSIRSKLEYFIRGGSKNDVEKDKAVAAVALLVELCRPPKGATESHFPINLYFDVKEDGTAPLAITAMNALLDDHAWIDQWSNPQQKRRLLEQLTQALRQLQGDN
jgi:hypothetical protein